MKRFALLMTVSMIAAGATADMSDPTRPADYTVSRGGSAVSSRAGGPVLQSTLVSPQRKSAVISGKTVKIGDDINGAKVVDIAPYEVTLSRGGREIRLRLAPKLAKEKGKPNDTEH